MQKFTYGTKASDFGDAILDNYLATVDEPERTALRHVYDMARQLVPDAEEAVYYGMPCLKYRGKGLVAAMATKNFLSLYPFSNFEAVISSQELAGFETTKGSIHFSVEHPIPDDLLRKIIIGRLQHISE